MHDLEDFLASLKRQEVHTQFIAGYRASLEAVRRWLQRAGKGTLETGDLPAIFAAAQGAGASERQVRNLETACRAYLGWRKAPAPHLSSTDSELELAISPIRPLPPSEQMSPATAQQLPAVPLRGITGTHGVVGRITPVEAKRTTTTPSHAWTTTPEEGLSEIYRPPMPSTAQSGGNRIAVGPILAILGALLLIGGLIVFRPKGNGDRPTKASPEASSPSAASVGPPPYENACRRLERCCREQRASQFCGIVASQNLTACDNAIKNTKETEGIECK